MAYVPKQCVGAHRCPMAVILHDDVSLPRTDVPLWAPIAERYDLILLAPWKNGYWEANDEIEAHAAVDSAMTWALTKFAVDPKRIALIAHWSSGRAAMAFGGKRLDLFSRVVLATSDYLKTNVDSANHTTRFLVTECVENGRIIVNRIRSLQHDGHPVDAFVGFRTLRGGAEDHEWDVIGNWLQQSWTTQKNLLVPTPATPNAPLLTIEALQKMSDFWARFQREPDSVRIAGRLAHEHEVALWVPGLPLSVVMVDMPALAARYPSVAADLNAAGLTAQEHDAYRAALASAAIILDTRDSAGPTNLPTALSKMVVGSDPHLPVLPGSVTERNVEFMMQHDDLIGEPGTRKGMSGMWLTP
jgi:hypothetical protein